MVVIEHNLEVIKTADWIIDLGPEGGDGGGEIVAQGTPEDVVKVKRSYTGQFLKPVLARKEARAAGRRGSRRRSELPNTTYLYHTEANKSRVTPKNVRKDGTARNPNAIKYRTVAPQRLNGRDRARVRTQ